MLEQFSRTELLIGEIGLDKLANSKVAIFGVGGVGSFAAEALARAGVGKFVLIDNDDIDITNINRQIHATLKTVGKPKVEVMKERIININPEAGVNIIKVFLSKDNSEELVNEDYDYIVDSIDTVSAKLELIKRAKEKNIPIISSMGAGNKLEPTKFEVADISKTTMCPLARVIRLELKKRGIKKVKVVYSKEIPIKPRSKDNVGNTDARRKVTPGSISFVPSVVGLIIASEVVKDILNKK